jgi:hypothetical protein
LLARLSNLAAYSYFETVNHAASSCAAVSEKRVNLIHPPKPKFFQKENGGFELFSKTAVQPCACYSRKNPTAATAVFFIAAGQL